MAIRISRHRSGRGEPVYIRYGNGQRRDHQQPLLDHKFHIQFRVLSVGATVRGQADIDLTYENLTDDNVNKRHTFKQQRKTPKHRAMSSRLKLIAVLLLAVAALTFTIYYTRWRTPLPSVLTIKQTSTVREPYSSALANQFAPAAKRSSRTHSPKISYNAS